MWISKLVCLFMLYSLCGWIFESIYCTVVKGYWENRGFLYGPFCPIYGVGACLITIIDDRLPQHLTADRLYIFLISFFGSMVLEYVTSWVLETLFHAVWWDYSKLPLNIHGRTSVPTSIGFGLAGIVVVDYLSPQVQARVNAISPIETEFWALLLTVIFSIDMTLTVSALTNFARIVSQMDDALNERMENLVASTRKRSLEIRNRIALDSMGELRQLALKRVSDFRYPSVNREHIKQLLAAFRRNAR